MLSEMATIPHLLSQPWVVPSSLSDSELGHEIFFLVIGTISRYSTTRDLQIGCTLELTLSCSSWELSHYHHVHEPGLVCWVLRHMERISRHMSEGGIDQLTGQQPMSKPSRDQLN